ncbi:MAG: lipopolysaccharide heptosyltransferase II [Candidatus Latescibacterota bacterium]|nr:MAG: lipopolysaccharide heptosyltransferase II [Candidatus Latescibacterota bacterium]
MADSNPRILCIAPSWLGDAVLALPALQLLSDAGAHLEIVARRGITRVFAAVAQADALHAGPGSRRERFVQAWRLRGVKPHAALLLAPSFSTALQAALAGAPIRIGESRDLRRPLLTHPGAAGSRETHLALTYQRLAEELAAALRLDVAMPDSAPQQNILAGLYDAPRLQPRDSETEAAAALLRGAGCSDRPLVVAPGARFGPAKRYPSDRFAEAARRLAQRLDTGVVLVGSSEDARETAAVQAGLRDAIDLAGRTDLGALLGLLALARGVLSNDSGVMHLAAALGTPVVGIFGSSNPRWTHPLGRRAGFVSNPVPCAPCYRRTCPIDFECMLGLEPEVLVVKLFDLIRSRSTHVPESPSRL